MQSIGGNFTSISMAMASNFRPDGNNSIAVIDLTWLTADRLCKCQRCHHLIRLHWNRFSCCWRMSVSVEVEHDNEQRRQRKRFPSIRFDWTWKYNVTGIVMIFETIGCRMNSLAEIIRLDFRIDSFVTWSFPSSQLTAFHIRYFLDPCKILSSP